jgi:hypothetical protein
MIDHLNIINFKAFASADIRLAPFTLLSGLNSSGKSTVLQALALLRQGLGSLEDMDGEGGLPLNGEIVDLGTGQDILHEDYIAEPGEVAEIGFRLTAEEDSVYECRVRYGKDDDYLFLSYCTSSLQPSTWPGNVTPSPPSRCSTRASSTCGPIGSARLRPTRALSRYPSGVGSSGPAVNTRWTFSAIIWTT